MPDQPKHVQAAMLGCEIRKRKYGAVAKMIGGVVKMIGGVEGYYWAWDFYGAANMHAFPTAEAAADDFLSRYGGTAEYFRRTGLRHYGRKLEPAPVCVE